jgi:hypothetical protein
MLTYDINGKDYTVCRLACGVSVLDVDTHEWVDCDFVRTSPEPAFIWEGTTVCLAQPKKITCDEFNALVEDVKGERCRYHELEDPFVRMILTEGITSLKFSVPMATGCLLYDRDKTVKKICHITERRYKIINQYKIELECSNPEDGVMKRDSWYISDFIDYLIDGTITVMKSY